MVRKYDIAIIAITAILFAIGFAKYYLPTKNTLSTAVDIPADDNIRWLVAMNITTNGIFAAQTPMDISVLAFPINATKTYPNIGIVFQDAIVDPPRYVASIPVAATKSLQRVPDPTSIVPYYTGEVRLLYPDEGPKCILVITNFENTFPLNEREVADVYRGDCIPIKTIAGTEIVPTITISSLDAKYQYETNKATLFLTWVVVGLTVLLSRDIIKGFVQDYWRSSSHSNQSGSNTSPADKKEKSKRDKH